MRAHGFEALGLEPADRVVDIATQYVKVDVIARTDGRGEVDPALGLERDHGAGEEIRRKLGRLPDRDHPVVGDLAEVDELCIGQLAGIAWDRLVVEFDDG